MAESLTPDSSAGTLVLGNAQSVMLEKHSYA